MSPEMNKTEKLRELLAGPGALVLPGCFDALSARLIERAGFKAAFMGGFAVSASRIGAPDTGLISYSEMLDQGRDICAAVEFPVIGDGDTGYGNAVNVQRTVRGYAQAGFACVMIEDQVAPKKCGHTSGKQVVGRDEAFARIQAAVDTREEGADILIMARTDANATDGMDEAVARAQAFAEIGADITFLEAPRNEDEMRRYCADVPGPKMANLVEGGDTPLVAPEKLGEIGYNIVIYPISLMLAGLKAMEDALGAMRGGAHPGSHPGDLAEFAHLRDVVGFPAYYDAEKKYAAD